MAQDNFNESDKAFIKEHFDILMERTELVRGLERGDIQKEMWIKVQFNTDHETQAATWLAIKEGLNMQAYHLNARGVNLSLDTKQARKENIDMVIKVTRGYDD
jgi:hypothetical protein